MAPPDTRGTTGRALVKQHQSLHHDRLHAEYNRPSRFHNTPCEQKGRDVLRSGGKKAQAAELDYAEVAETYRRVGNVRASVDQTHDAATARVRRKNRLGRVGKTSEARRRERETKRALRDAHSMQRVRSGGKAAAARSDFQSAPASYKQGLGKQLTEQRRRRREVATASVDSHEHRLLLYDRLHGMRERNKKDLSCNQTGRGKGRGTRGAVGGEMGGSGQGARSHSASAGARTKAGMGWGIKGGGGMGLRMGQAEEREEQEDVVPLRDAATARKDLDQRRRRRGRSAGKFTPRLLERRTMARVMGDFGESATETSTVPRITRRRLVHDTMRPPDEKDELVPRLVHRRRGPALLKRSYNPVQVRSTYSNERNIRTMVGSYSDFGFEMEYSHGALLCSAVLCCTLLYSAVLYYTLL